MSVAVGGTGVALGIGVFVLVGVGVELAVGVGLGVWVAVGSVAVAPGMFAFTPQAESVSRQISSKCTLRRLIAESPRGSRARIRRFATRNGGARRQQRQCLPCCQAGLQHKLPVRTPRQP